MAENKMKEVAKLLGVELEEEFKIKGFTNKCKLSTYGLMCWSDTSQDWVLSSAIGELLNGLTRDVCLLLNGIIPLKIKMNLKSLE